MEWHSFYIWGILFVAINAWALMSYDPNTVDPEIEKMWEDHL
jgi:hypothetical protein